MSADDVTVRRSRRGRPKGLMKTRVSQLIDPDDLFNLGINLSNSSRVAVTPPRVSKRHKNARIMADGVPTVIVPVSSRRKLRSARVSTVNSISCEGGVLIDTTNFSREPECTIVQKPIEVDIRCSTPGISRPTSPPAPCTSPRTPSEDPVTVRSNCAVKLIHTTCAPNLDVELPSFQTEDADGPAIETLDTEVHVPVTVVSNVPVTAPLASVVAVTNSAIQPVAGTQMFLSVSDEEWKKVTKTKVTTTKKIMSGQETSSTHGVYSWALIHQRRLKSSVMMSSESFFPNSSWRYANQVASAILPAL